MKDLFYSLIYASVFIQYAALFSSSRQVLGDPIPYQSDFKLIFFHCDQHTHMKGSFGLRVCLCRYIDRRKEAANISV